MLLVGTLAWAFHHSSHIRSTSGTHTTGSQSQQTLSPAIDCQATLAAWVLAEANAMSAGDSQATSQPYLAFGYQNPTSTWIVDEAGVFYRDSFQEGVTAATNTMMGQVDSACVVLVQSGRNNLPSAADYMGQYLP